MENKLKLNIRKSSILSNFNNLNEYTIQEVLQKIGYLLETSSIKEIKPIFNENYTQYKLRFIFDDDTFEETEFIDLYKQINRIYLEGDLLKVEYADMQVESIGDLHLSDINTQLQNLQNNILLINQTIDNINNALNSKQPLLFNHNIFIKGYRADNNEDVYIRINVITTSNESYTLNNISDILNVYSGIINCVGEYYKNGVSQDTYIAFNGCKIKSNGFDVYTPRLNGSLIDTEFFYCNYTKIIDEVFSFNNENQQLRQINNNENQQLRQINNKEDLKITCIKDKF